MFNSTDLYEIFPAHKDWTFTDGSKIKNDKGKIIQNWPPKQQMAIYDDHDYGLNDQDASFQYKNIGKVRFLKNPFCKKYLQKSFFCGFLFDRKVSCISEIN